MISRRNIRVKVMQTLYTVSTSDTDTQPGKALEILKQHFDQTRSLLVYLTYFLTEVARYAETDARHRAAKHLRTAEDLHVNIKIAGNEQLLKILKEPTLKEQFLKDKPELKIDRELVKKIYHALTEKQEYKTYISHPERNSSDERKILELILNDLMLADEMFVVHIEDNYSNWDDDAELVIQLLASFIHKPGAFNFNQMLSADKAQFAEILLKTVLEKKDLLKSLITPKLKNWDPERIAMLDMILMEMGVSEFLFFETIPPKVTINEYIDLAKEYSTQQSGQFVNGILDNIHKEMVLQGNMKKVDYKKA
jgi:N utilization substance protein B